MYRFSRISLALAAAAGLALAACSDDNPAADSNPPRPDTVNPDPDSGPQPDIAADSVPTDSGPQPDGDASGSYDGFVPLQSICFQDIGDPNNPGPNYDQFFPKYGRHCFGTNHQDIQGIQKVVFLGDSITEGTPPTPFDQYYRNRLVAMLEAKFGPLEVQNCAKWGARTDDLIEDNTQVTDCFPGVEQKTSLTIMTVGGNDGFAWAKDYDEGKTMPEIMAMVDEALAKMREAVEYLKDPAHFPNGNYVIFANIYEYTDGTGDLWSCPLALIGGIIPFLGVVPQSWPEGRPAYLRYNEQYMKIAVDTGSDMVFLLENFCGHGFKASDPTNECYRGPGAETWFDLTCIHPTPVGHEQIANMFMAVVNE